MRYKVRFTYESGRIVRSRYGVTRAVEQAVRFVSEEDLDEAIEQFRSCHEVSEVRIEKRP